MQPWDDEMVILPFNIFEVQKLVGADDDGVWTSIMVLFQSEQHDEQIGVVLHPSLARTLAEELVEVAKKS